jgi:hypothetical protein
MSYCGAIPVDAEPSDSNVLIDACLASVRKNAGLDNESVFVPLKRLLEADAPKRVVVGPSVHELPTAEEIVRSAVKASSPPASIGEPVVHGDVTAVPSKRKRTRCMRWPVFLCGFVAGVFGGIAFMKSPVGQKPPVQSVVQKVQSHVATVWGARSRIVHVP